MSHTIFHFSKFFSHNYILGSEYLQYLYELFLYLFNNIYCHKTVTTYLLDLASVLLRLQDIGPQLHFSPISCHLNKTSTRLQICGCYLMTINIIYWDWPDVSIGPGVMWRLGQVHCWHWAWPHVVIGPGSMLRLDLAQCKYWA